MSGKEETRSSIFSFHDLPFSVPSTGVDSSRIVHEVVPAKRHKTEDYSAKNKAGNVFIWGESEQVTDFDDEQPRLLPFPVKFFKGNAVKICAGSEHVLVLTDSGEVYSWGQNDSGALGRKTDSAIWNDVILENQPENEVFLDSSAMPGEMSIPAELGKVLQISAGEFHSAGLLERNIFWICGAFYTGENFSRIAPGVERSLTYQIVQFYNSQNPQKNNNNALEACSKIKKISCGGNHIIILKESGEVWGMGYGELGQLGGITDDMIHRHAPKSEIESVVRDEWKNKSLITIPIKLNIPEKPIADIFTGKNCTFLKGGITGKIFACGVNNGQLGIIAPSDETQNQNNTQLQNNNSNLVLNNSRNQQQQQQCGMDNNMQNQQNNGHLAENNNNNQNNDSNIAAIQNNNVKNNGIISDIQENNNNQNNDSTIAAIQNNNENNKDKISDFQEINQTNGNTRHFFNKVDQNNDGNIDAKQNNNNNNSNDIIFDFQEAFKGLKIVQISSGRRHTLALTNSGQIYVCGNSQDGCLGIVTNQKKVYEPVLLNVFENNNNQDQNNKYTQFVSCGEEFSGCVDNEGTGYLWGNGDCYKMANKSEEKILVPMRMKRTRSFNHEKIIDMALGYNYGAVISISGERFSV